VVAAVVGWLDYSHNFMADIFADTQPPAWLQRMTQPSEPGMLGKIFGDLVGGLATSAETAIDKAKTKNSQGDDTNWIKELPGSIHEGFANAQMSLRNPLWKMQAQQAQLNMAQQGLAIKNQQSLIEARATKLRMQEHDQDTLPKWLQEHPTWESRQDAEPPILYTSEGQRMFRDVQLGDTANIKHKALVSGLSSNSKALAQLEKLDPAAAASIAPLIGKADPGQVQQKLDSAMAAAQAKVVPKAQSPLGKLEADREVAVSRGAGAGELEAFDAAIAAFKKVKPEAAPKPSAALSSELQLGRERLLNAEKALNDPAMTAKNPRRKELEKERQQAEDFYYSVLSEVRTVTAPKAPAATGTPTAAGTNQKDPLGLGF
jgi:hypothetical protein